MLFRGGRLPGRLRCRCQDGCATPAPGEGSCRICCVISAFLSRGIPPELGGSGMETVGRARAGAVKASLEPGQR